MIERLKLIVYGVAAPQGSKRAIPIYRGSARNGTREWTGRSAVVESSTKVKPWREDICAAVRERFPEPGDLEAAGYPIAEPCCGRVVFTVPAIADKRRPYPHKKPDVDKLLRSTLDALKTAGVWTDDALLVDMCRLAKRYPLSDPEALGRPGAYIELHAVHPPWIDLGHLDEIEHETPAGALF